jgi:DNA gyrase subunit A
MLREVLKQELIEVRDKYGDERKTEITALEDEIDIEDLIEEEECVFTLTAAGYIKRIPVSTYRTQRRGGRGITAQSLREADYVDTLFTASTHDDILFFTNKGRVYRKKGYHIPEAGRPPRAPISSMSFRWRSTKSQRHDPHPRFDENIYLVMVTRGGTVKRNAAGRAEKHPQSGQSAPCAWTRRRADFGAADRREAEHHHCHP